MQGKTKDLTKGNPIKLILLFGFPLLIGNLFQQLYNLVDTAIVGHTLGDTALAAVGASSSICNLIMSLSFGFTTGFGIIISRYFGAKNMAALRKCVAASLVQSLCISIITTFIATFFLKPLLHLLGTPNNIINQAFSYGIIIMAGFAITMFSSLFLSVLRALGNSRTPLIYQVIGCVFNIGLDFLFIKGFHLGVRGAAIATIIAQVVTGILSLRYIKKNCKELIPSKEDFRYEKHLWIDNFSSGLSMSMMFSIVNIGSVILQSAINGFGAATITAHVAARKVSEVLMSVLSALSSSCATFTSQNYGAGQMKRVREGVTKGILLGFIWSTFAIIFIYLTAPHLITALTGSHNSYIIETASLYLRIDLPFYYILTVLVVLRNALQGIGAKILPLFSSTTELLGKIFVVVILAPRIGYMGIIICEPITWILCAIIVGIAFYRNPLFRKTA